MCLQGRIVVSQKVTILNVADKAGVSISTVHQALNGKKGVSEKTRERIRRIAEELGYQPNPMASGLKRRTQNVAIVLPGTNYYQTVWNAVRDYLPGPTGMNLCCREMPFSEGVSGEEPGKIREQILSDLPDGLLITGHSDILTMQDWETLHDAGVAVSLIGADLPQSYRILCVQPDYDIVGRTMAELVLSRIPSYGSIAMCAGNPRWEPHSKVVKGFMSFLQEKGAPNRVYSDHSWNRKEESYRGILKMVSQPDVAACCSVLSQSSVLLGRALEETGKAGKIFAVGSDLSDENVAYLEKGVFSNLIQKNPYAQGYLGIRSLAEYLTQGRQPGTPRVFVGSEVVFSSNIRMFRDKSYRSLLG